MVEFHQTEVWMQDHPQKMVFEPLVTQQLEGARYGPAETCPAGVFKPLLILAGLAYMPSPTDVENK